MAEFDPAATQRDLGCVAELAAAGFEDVVEIGRGGFGVVFRCRQPSLARTVAVKVLTADHNADNVERFLREQQAMGRLSDHPNIVTIHQVGTTAAGRPYIVMPYHARDSLESWIRQHGPLDWPAAVQLGIRMAGALESAHRLGMLHRDVKPGNILLTDYGDEQLGDFGIARVSGGFETTSTSITGSPAYTAPEVLEGQSPSAASDIYSLGATLFCAITGHAAFERRSGEQLVTQFLRITKEPVPDLREHYPADVCDAIEKAMARETGQRFTSAAEFGEHLRGIQPKHGLTTDTLLVTDQPRSGDSRSTAINHGSVAPSDEVDINPPAPAEPRTRLRVFVADDHPVYREGLVRHWMTSPAITVAGSTGDGSQVVSAIERLHPDVAVVDLRLPGAGGLEILDRLAGTGSTTLVLILTAYVDSATVYRALAAGARGFLEKSASLDEITQAVTTIAGGGTVIAPMVSGVLADEIRLRGRGEHQSLLTQDETTIVNLAADGLSTQQIADELGITVTTVKSRLTRIYGKLGVTDRAAAVAQAFRRGLLS